MATSIPVLTFHAIDDRSSVISFPSKVFQFAMAKLHENGYRTIALQEAVHHISRQQTFPDRSFVITFDDGYQTVYKEAFPTLCRFAMSATVFLAVGEKRGVNTEDRLPSLEGRAMLSWHEIREMARWRITFGAHTLTHSDLRRQPTARVEEEICGSKTVIEENLGHPVRCFVAPYGRYDPRSLGIIRRHFDCACTDRLGLITLRASPYELQRVDAYYLRTLRLFRLMSTPLFPLYIRARSIPRSIRRAFGNV